eukprot:364418-Chlamydomonas_euryale.AAC.7
MHGIINCSVVQCYVAGATSIQGAPREEILASSIATLNGFPGAPCLCASFRPRLDHCASLLQRAGVVHPP